MVRCMCECLSGFERYMSEKVYRKAFLYFITGYTNQGVGKMQEGVWKIEGSIYLVRY